MSDSWSASRLQARFSQARVLVTGGLGFLGSTLAHALVQLGANVSLLDSLAPGCGGNRFNLSGIEERVRIKIGDINDADTTHQFVQGQDYLFNLAGTLSHVDSMQDPYADLQVNCRGQLVLLEACRRYNPSVKIVFTGTRGQYGRPRYLPIDESHPTVPVDINGIHKHAAESYHILYGRTYGIRSCSLRLTNSYGPRHQMRHGRQGYLNWFVRLALEGQPITVYGDGSQVRDFTYVDDVVRALLMAAASPNTDGEIYNVGSGVPVSVLESAHAVIAAAGGGRVQKVEYPGPERSVEVGSYCADYRKFNAAVGWAPAVSLAEGLVRTVDYYRGCRKHYWDA